MMSDKEKIVLFDMDGTLTAPRGQVEPKIIHALRLLSQYSKIGIITGSDYDYVMQQMSSAFDIGGIPVDKIDILPCNGTKKYVADNSNNFVLSSEVNMIKEIGRDHYRSLIQFCAEAQSMIIEENPEIEFTGTFLQYRGSLLNWCPVGRSAGDLERKSFTDVDEEKNLRVNYSNALKDVITERKIPVTIALGGSTSLDIYPNGWDKTYGLTHYPNHDIWFVGDRCEEGGNDWHIYEALKEVNRSFHIHDPDGTITVIDKIIASFKDN